MQKGRVPQVTNEEVFEAIRPLLVTGEWTEVSRKTMVDKVAEETGIKYTANGLRLKLESLIAEGKLEYISRWPIGKWRLLGEEVNTNGTSSSPESKENLIS